MNYLHIFFKEKYSHCKFLKHSLVCKHENIKIVMFNKVILEKYVYLFKDGKLMSCVFY